MKYVEIKQKNKDDLERMLQEKQEKLRELRFNLISGKVKNVREVRVVRKEIARIKTALKITNNQ